MTFTSVCTGIRTFNVCVLFVIVVCTVRERSRSLATRTVVDPPSTRFQPNI
jgi:hypothetical protein